ncbi:hypothetical protein CKF54_01650 [Psittacicella hinzii]|uniref:GCVT N-terminal domain-containing protein n=1 Tax=Psittacicella hinzii TaxID=2028575 RepID=A0A3A1Y7F1_9GAMM|nr:hypothetical protein [Psittacicella hinzii]RIY34162.1 hypothetical protein CKF54_01650 [Psittacicella hinzii]
MKIQKNWYYISFKGKDASKFLQGQIPVNLDTLQVGSSTYSCVTFHTGKVIATFRLVKVNENSLFMLVYGKTNADRLLAHFKKYAIFSDVAIELVSNCEIYLATLSDYELGYKELNDNIALVNTTGNTAFFIAEQNTTPETLRELLSNNEVELLSEEQFFTLTTLNGFVYNLKDEYVDKFLPQALGIDHIEEAISYRKGCYQGQEGIARAKFRGVNSQTHVTFKVTNESKIELQHIEVTLMAKLDNGSLKSSGYILGIYQQDENTWLVDTVLSSKLLPEETNYCLEVNETKSTFDLTPIKIYHSSDVTP